MEEVKEVKKVKEVKEEMITEVKPDEQTDVH